MSAMGYGIAPISCWTGDVADVRAAVEEFAKRGIILLPSHVRMKIFEARQNGIRVVHGEARLRGLDLEHISGSRWRSHGVRVERVRACRGQRRRR